MKYRVISQPSGHKPNTTPDRVEINGKIYTEGDTVDESDFRQKQDAATRLEEFFTWNPHLRNRVPAVMPPDELSEVESLLATKHIEPVG